MSGEAIALILIAVAALDVVGVIAVAYFWQRGETIKRRARDSVKTGARSLTSHSRERYTERLRDIDFALEEGRGGEALETAERLFEDLLSERGFPEEYRKNKKALTAALHTVSPEAAGKYVVARAQRAMASGAWRREKAMRLEEAAREYRAVCEALIGVGDRASR